MLVLESSQYLLALCLPLSADLTAFLGSLAQLLPITLLALTDLVTEVHGRQAIDQTILILEALLCHVKGLLHCHSEGHTKSQYEATKQ